MLAEFPELFFVAILGVCMGSFLNVLADRLPHERTILGRSKCDACDHELSWKDLVPVVSFCMLCAKCRYCKASLSFQYPVAEILTSVLYVLTWIFARTAYQNPFFAPVMLVLVSILFVMLLADIRYQILPDEMQIGMAVVSLILLWMKMPDLSLAKDVSIYWGSAIAAGFAVMSPLLLLFLLTKGRGMGFGDVKYAFNLGLLLGIWGGLSALYLGFLTGGLVGAVILLLKRGGLKSKIAFGPFLILGTYLVLFFENDVILMISRMYGFY